MGKPEAGHRHRYRAPRIDPHHSTPNRRSTSFLDQAAWVSLAELLCVRTLPSRRLERLGRTVSVLTTRPADRETTAAADAGIAAQIAAAVAVFPARPALVMTAGEAAHPVVGADGTPALEAAFEALGARGAQRGIALSDRVAAPQPGEQAAANASERRLQDGSSRALGGDQSHHGIESLRFHALPRFLNTDLVVAIES